MYYEENPETTSKNFETLTKNSDIPTFQENSNILPETSTNHGKKSVRMLKSSNAEITSGYFKIQPKYTFQQKQICPENFKI